MARRSRGSWRAPGAATDDLGKILAAFIAEDARQAQLRRRRAALRRLYDLTRHAEAFAGDLLAIRIALLSELADARAAADRTPGAFLH